MFVESVIDVSGSVFTACFSDNNGARVYKTGNRADLIDFARTVLFIADVSKIENAVNKPCLV